MTLADRAASEPALERVLRESATRYRRLGRVGGTVRLERLSAAEARALAGLGVCGRRVPLEGSDVTVSLAALDRALGGGAGEGLRRALGAAGHDLATNLDRATARRADVDALWARAQEHDACADPQVAAWASELPGRGRIAAVAIENDGAALHACLDALALVTENDGGAWDRAVLASDITGNPHAFDDGQPTHTLLLSALAHRDGLTRTPAEAAARRALLERHGIASDPLSSTVLVAGLQVTGRGPAARLLAAAAGTHAVLTLAQIADSRLHRITTALHTTEGSIVVRCAQQHLHGSHAPLVCTEGQPSAACDQLLRQLRPVDCAHSGDFDWGGLRIGGVLRRRHGATPWRHDRAEYMRHADRLRRRTTGLPPPTGQPPAGYADTWGELARRRVPVWQEDLIDELLTDLAL